MQRPPNPHPLPLPLPIHLLLSALHDLHLHTQQHSHLRHNMLSLRRRLQRPAARVLRHQPVKRDAAPGQPNAHRPDRRRGAAGVWRQVLSVGVCV
ncbi:hypothetical protein K491DRAFT_694619 [Lophiostoma macrostomum CBS 122681]|uniref:Uncharacterized protein n=1 Tax=Lophiostoma macrostomum CBS 122681 TaxID=1314788 RepID=A0A6A6T1K6_9PLEO|nr:hypothetical protein K491DRAFT_694619 [Lophiostoma macrostomum CBS 122681]